MFYLNGNNCSKPQVAEIRQFKEVEHFPNMNTWAPIKRNILTEDDNHINIPYFGDQVDILLKHVFPFLTMYSRSLMKIPTSLKVSRPMSVRT